MNKNLRIIYMGTPEFAVPALELLVKEGWNVVAVISAPDKPQGRGKKMGSSPVKVAADALGIPVLQPTNLKSPLFQEQLKSYQADLQVVVAFRMLPESVWSMPPQGTFNLHASLLPNYRGAAPINWVLINGEKETGVTTFFLKHAIDTGNIIHQEKEPIYEDDDAGKLYERLMRKGAELVLKTVEDIASGTVVPQAQDDTQVKHHAPKIFKETCKIDWNRSAVEIHNLIRGLSPYPAAWTEVNGKSCKLTGSKPINADKKDLIPGMYATDNKSFLHFQTGDGMLAITSLQAEGKRRMEIEEYLRGNTL
ncbi:Methionyl-tRNA formyltransferase [Lunatimonas lonarensis]|uniref:Methionyl-tRNA formyltransferase n=1 Tax=Lunatimonas lonarensis TaxID=1232681 RepID=R7ZYR7_9BACT|nr:methionyl-tRNA formyltransferase [Lunatimonas lonarensis]EON79188.1 Methionyl-tRNA formyltransferase [Lunatimonas lonarensis]